MIALSWKCASLLCSPGLLRLCAIVVLSFTWIAAKAKAETEAEKFSAILAKADLAYGEYLAGQCVTCHLPTAETKGIPPVAGLQDLYLVQTLLEYQQGTEGRTNAVMANVAKNLSAEEIGSLAKYFSQQPAE